MARKKDEANSSDEPIKHPKSKKKSKVDEDKSGRFVGLILLLITVLLSLFFMYL